MKLNGLGFLHLPSLGLAAFRYATIGKSFSGTYTPSRLYTNLLLLSATALHSLPWWRRRGPHL